MQKQMLGTFASLLPKGAQVLVAEPSDSLQTRQWLSDHGYETLTTEKDLRFFQVQRESLDAVWCHRLPTKKSWNIDELHRVLGIFFQALKPKTGILFLSFQSTQYPQPEKTVYSLLRQSGFLLPLNGTWSEDDSKEYLALISKRV